MRGDAQGNQKDRKDSIAGLYAPEAYFTPLDMAPDGEALRTLAERMFGQAFRGGFDAPGFALVRLGQNPPSGELRHFMVELKSALGDIHLRERGSHLAYVSLLRFDQQATTRFHLDGAPDESCLMLGYEPSVVRSEVRMADYARAAHDLGISPAQFLTDYNPMTARGEQQLTSYITRLDAFDARHAHVLLVNNSRLPYDENGRNLQGVMHQATILTPDPAQSRVVNSLMLTASNAPSETPALAAMRQEFLG